MPLRTAFRKTVLTAALAFTLTACINQSGDVTSDDSPRENQGNNVSVVDQPVVDSPTTANGGSARCVSFKTANATVTTRIDPGCTSCRIANAAAASDNDGDSHADLIVNNAAPSQGAALRATAQAGVIFPAGQLAGVIYSAPRGTLQNTTVTISTLAGGVVQETTSSNNTSGTNGGRSKSFTGIRTAKAFDAVEIAINNSQSEMDPTFQIFELCGDYR